MQSSGPKCKQRREATRTRTCGMPSVSIMPVLAYSTSSRPNFESGQPGGASRDTFSYSQVEPEPLSPASARPSMRPVVAPVGAAISTKPSSVSSMMSIGLTVAAPSSHAELLPSRTGELLFAPSVSELSDSAADAVGDDSEKPESIDGSCMRMLEALTPSISDSARHRPDAGPRPQNQSMRASARPPSAGKQNQK